MSRVSVIIPTHRLDSWLDEAVGSALQSVGVDPDVIVVINGVPRQEQRGWMADERVTVLFTPERLGPTRAMIRGVEASSSTYVARLDADDRMRPTRLAQQMRYLDAHPETPLVGTAVQRIDASGAPAGAVELPTGDDVRRHLILYNTIAHSSVLMRRSVLDEVGGYDPALAQMEDYDVILRMGLTGPLAVLPDTLTEYRIHPTQISRGARPSGPHIDAVLTRRRELGRRLGVPLPGIWARNSVWRGVQYARYWRVIRPRHEVR